MLFLCILHLVVACRLYDLCYQHCFYVFHNALVLFISQWFFYLFFVGFLEKLMVYFLILFCNNFVKVTSFSNCRGEWNFTIVVTATSLYIQQRARALQNPEIRMYAGLTSVCSILDEIRLNTDTSFVIMYICETFKLFTSWAKFQLNW